MANLLLSERSLLYLIKQMVLEDMSPQPSSLPPPFFSHCQAITLRNKLNKIKHLLPCTSELKKKKLGF